MRKHLLPDNFMPFFLRAFIVWSLIGNIIQSLQTTKHISTYQQKCFIYRYMHCTLLRCVHSVSAYLCMFLYWTHSVSAYLCMFLYWTHSVSAYLCMFLYWTHSVSAYLCMFLYWTHSVSAYLCMFLYWTHSVSAYLCMFLYWTQLHCSINALTNVLTC